MLKLDFKLNRGEFSLAVQLELPNQGVTALFGRSGSGKTTLLRCIAGLEKSAQGNLVFDGQVWQGARAFLPVHQRPIGYVFQEASLFPHLKVTANLLYGFKRIKAEQKKLQPDEVIDLLGIESLLERYPDQLSGGQRQRVAIGRALLTSPKLLLMDEPMASLDTTSKAEILPFLEKLRGQLALPIIYVSHALEEVTRLADHLVLLEQGQVIGEGELQNLLTDPNLPFIQTTSASSVLRTTTVQAATHDGLTELKLGNQPIFISQANLIEGQLARVRVMASDVVLALTPPTETSLLNCLTACILDFQPDLNTSQVLVRLEIAKQTLLARVSKRSVERLNLKENQLVYALIKGLALS